METRGEKIHGLIFVSFGLLGGYLLLPSWVDYFKTLPPDFFSLIDIFLFVSQTLLTAALLSGGWLRIRHSSDEPTRRYLRLKKGINFLVFISAFGIFTSLALPNFGPTEAAWENRIRFGVAKANVDYVRSALDAYAEHPEHMRYPLGEMTFEDIKNVLPELDLPPLESDAKWASNSLFYQSGSGYSYTITVRANTFYQEVITGTPAGITPDKYPH